MSVGVRMHLFSFCPIRIWWDYSIELRHFEFRTNLDQDYCGEPHRLKWFLSRELRDQTPEKLQWLDDCDRPKNCSTYKGGQILHLLIKFQRLDLYIAQLWRFGWFRCFRIFSQVKLKFCQKLPLFWGTIYISHIASILSLHYICYGGKEPEKISRTWKSVAILKR